MTAEFLTKAKRLMSAGNYAFVPRKKNLQSPAECGLSISDVKNEIMDLCADDYYKGSKQDFDPGQPGDIWEFKRYVDGRKFYVKLKIQEQNGKDFLKCLSFHEDDYC